MKRIVALVVFFASAVLACCAQAAEPQPNPAGIPQIKYELNWRGADPQWFQIVIDSTGRATYQSQPRSNDPANVGDPFMVKFTASQMLTKQLFGAAQELHYFDGEFDYRGSGRIASTGNKTVTYEAQGKKFSTSFNYSDNRTLTSFAGTMQNISTCLELGRRIDYSLRFDKLGVEKQITELENLFRQGRTPVLTALEPLLQKVVDDPQTMNMTRQKAKSLLRAAEIQK